MDSRVPTTGRRRGRPSKFGRPSRVVALTLPEDAIDRLHRVHRDLGWAILNLLDQKPPRGATRSRIAEPDVELVSVADRRSLIVVNREVIKNLPGVNIVPLNGNRAFLALEIDRGMSDLELAVSDRLGDAAIDRGERRALVALRARLTTWRRDADLLFHTRAIIVVEQRRRSSDRDGQATARGAAAKRAAARAWARAIGAKAGADGDDRVRPSGRGRPSTTIDRRARRAPSHGGVSTNKHSESDLGPANSEAVFVDSKSISET
jgi:hypothetical protein